MAARQKYPPVHVQLRELAVEAKLLGVSFECFWEEAIRPGAPPVVWRTPRERRPPGCVVWPNDTEDRAAAREIMNDPEVIEGWRRAYEDERPRRRDAALRILAPLVDGELRGFEDFSAVASSA